MNSCITEFGLQTGLGRIPSTKGLKVLVCKVGGIHYANEWVLREPYHICTKCVKVGKTFMVAEAGPKGPMFIHYTEPTIVLAYRKLTSSDRWHQNQRQKHPKVTRLGRANKKGPKKATPQGNQRAKGPTLVRQPKALHACCMQAMYVARTHACRWCKTAHRVANTGGGVQI